MVYTIELVVDKKDGKLKTRHACGSFLREWNKVM